MCGILVAFYKINEVDICVCNRALDRLKLRGPDHSFQELYYDNRLFFGQTVLSITGNPVNVIDSYHKSYDKSYDIVLNGEIYNHEELYCKFLKNNYQSISGTDTETLVNLHQVLPPVNVYDQLKGMFSYVVYDNERHRLIICRDIVGEKILYHYEDEGVFILSSEIGPILELRESIKINRDVLRNYFYTRHLLNPVNTTFNGVKLIKPGHVLEYDLNKKSLKILSENKLADYINPDIIAKNKERLTCDIINEFESILKATANDLKPHSINYISVFSGGIDSSLASKYLSDEKTPAKFIALEFPQKGKITENLAGFTGYLNSPLYTVPVSVEDFVSFFNDCYIAACSPLSTHSFISQAIMSKKVREDGFKVLIGGDGADELFGGYEAYKKLINYSGFPDSNPSPYSGFIPHGVQFEEWEPEEIMQETRDRWSKYSAYYQFERDPTERLIQTVLYSDTVIQLESVGIRSADTMSMVNSVESRCFFLSNDIMKFALNLPAYFKIDLTSQDDSMVTKPILKNVFIRKFEKELLFPKQGFSGYPNEAGRLLVGDNYPRVREVLGLRNTPKTNGRLSQAIEWKLINTELFLRYFNKHI